MKIWKSGEKLRSSDLNGNFAEVSAVLAGVGGRVASKADAEDVYTKAQTDALLAAINAGGAVADTTPDAFAFTSVTGAGLLTAYTSNAILINGITGLTPISIVGGTYSKNGAAFTAASGTVVNGDLVSVRLTSSGTAGVTTSAMLSIGGVNAVFNVTTATAAGAAPVNTTIPQITPGTAQVGVTLTCDPGAWTGTPAPTFAFQWQYADTLADILGATSQTYTPVSGDAGHPLRCRVAGSNGVGAPVIGYSSPTSAVLSANTTAAPAIITGPTISGQAVDGGVLTLNYGVWSGSPAPTFTQQWIYGDTGAAIPNQTGSTLVVNAARDAGHTIKCVVTGGNGVGNPITVTTAATAIVPGLKPINTAVPQLNPGFGAVGDTLALLTGSWTSSDPITFSYKWFRADTNELLATTSTYALQAADAGHFIRAEVVATNRWGASDPALTAWSGQITGTSSGGGTGGSGTTPTSPPSVVSPPVISGSTTQGSALSVTQGVYNG